MGDLGLHSGLDIGVQSQELEGKERAQNPSQEAEGLWLADKRKIKENFISSRMNFTYYTENKNQKVNVLKLYKRVRLPI